MDATWTTLGILSAGIVVVVGGVLVFRLHAFLSLVLGACMVAALTPTETVEQYALDRDGFRVVAPSSFAELYALQDGERRPADADDSEVLIRAKKGQHVEPGLTCRHFAQDEASRNSQKPAGGETLRITRLGEGVRPNGVVERVAWARFEADEDPPTADAGDLLVPLAVVQAARSLAGRSFADRVTDGFGNTCGSIGILIALASIIGMCLLESGAADRIVRTALNRFGEKGAPVSFVSTGFLLGIPVFFDTVFYLMIPLAKALQMRLGRNYLLYVLTIVAGGTMAHSLVPPTPGPLFVAEQLGVDLGLMILVGCGVGFFGVVFGYFYAVVANRIWELPLRESPEFSLSDLREIAERDESQLPSFWISLMPIVLPVIFIGGNTVLQRFHGVLPADVVRIGGILGDKNVALGIAAAIALFTLIRQKRSNLRDLSGSIQSSLASGGVIILITAAGGAFGTVLQQTGVAGLIRDLPAASPVMIVTLAFLITTAIRTAQGSATVAMITAAGILSGLATGGDLGFHPVYIAIAIGCGSKPINWMNDSGFWVITRMSGMTEGEGLKYVTPMTSMMGVVGLIVTIVAVTVFPMA